MSRDMNHTRVARALFNGLISSDRLRLERVLLELR